MAELNLPNIREGGNIRFRIGLEDGGVAVDWSGLEDIRVFLYADAQKQVSGEMCEVAVDEEDNTVLKCKYSGDDVQYRGINSVLVRAKYLGEIKVYDKPAINIVARTSDATGVVEIDDPVVPVQISVEDVSTSLLNNAIDAAINAAAEAEKAAHLVPLQVLEDCVEATGKALEAASKAPYIDETTGNWFVWDAEAGEYVDSGKTARGATGNGIASWSVVESSEDAGNNVVTVTFTDGTSESFNVKNGHTGNGIASIVQTVESPDDAGTNVITITMTNGTVVTFNVKNGSKGTPGVAQAAYKSVSSLPTASAQTMDKIYLTPSGTSGVYNMSYTEFDGSAYSWQDLGTTAIQLSDYATKAELDQLEAEIYGNPSTPVSTNYSDAGYINFADGSIVTGNIWIHTPLLPIANVKSFGKFAAHSSVANVAFYATQERSSYISGIKTGYDEGTIPPGVTIHIEDITIPNDAAYIAFSTNGSTYPAITVETVELVGGLKDKVSDLESSVQDIEEEMGDAVLVTEQTLTDEQKEQARENIDAASATDVDAALNGTSEETTTNYSEAGSIKVADGTIVTGNTWIHTPLLPVSTVKEFGIIVGNAQVAAVAFYSTQELSSYISGITGGNSAGTCPTRRVVLMSEITIPEGANYVAFSTNGNNYSLTVKAQVNTPGLAGRVSALEVKETNLDARVSDLENNVVTSLPTKTLHFSFDDTISAFYDIVHNNRSSIFDNAFFGALKNLHETYGAVFSCYCFLDYIITSYVSKISTIENPSTTTVYRLSSQDGEFAPGWYVYKNGSWTSFNDVQRSDYVLFSLSSFPSTYATEFAENAKWLKFGLHCKDGMSNYGSATAEEAATDYNSFITSILAITGTPECVDTVVRLQNFSGSLNACRGLRDADLGVQGFLCADYSETGSGSGGMNQGYYLTNSDASAVWKKGQIYDYSERLHFYMSALRIDNTTGANMPAYMATFLTPSKWEQTAMIEMYAHENQMFNASSGTVGSDYIVRFTAICTWAKNNGFVFGYQMDKIRMAF